MNRINQLLAQNIKAARGRLGLSQMKLAESCGVSTSFIGEIEIARKFPSADTLLKLCEALGLRPHELFYEEAEAVERHEILASISNELKERIDTDIDEVVRKHLS